MARYFLKYAKYSSLALVALAGSATAEGYPERVVRMVVPFAAGGGTDVLGRAFAKELTEAFGQNVIVENIGGAAGFIGTQDVVRSDADGYTLLFAPTAPYTMAEHATPPATYDPAEDLIPVARIAAQPILFSVRSDSGFDTLADFLAVAKDDPGYLSFSSSGAGGEMHLTGEKLKQASGVDLLHVGYRGGGPAILALVSGEVDMMPVVTGSIMAYIQDGSVKALATTAPERLEKLPDVPTMTELGYPEVDHIPSWGVFVPAGTPDEVVAVLQEVSEKTATSVAFVEYLDTLSISPAYLPGADFLEVLKVQADGFGELMSTLDLGQ
ncbi:MULTISPECIES: Bug family tripartite tricarboxylate transporter substrate binding protein [Mameliella]|uniref:Bug family tripartite tricarboxylate transporter substrate binding protein n=1 Tax=Mameliella TaxID=1434019 RepID=UPI0010542AEA|nr:MULTISPECIES: tripartite tricarboxylate transporter substrate binding protein [Mameliella]MBY6122322.1 tripartite tricarboxylate transporter substrate binding protein [Mameliella alba]MCR9275543.1 tripartite tricarboxylate transporter substrate binding protein [Paracoccaceae bacterium]MDD9731013.1 tripartite tricarboxylate transporter substrate binding protein [Mameliella sp. AT18]